MARVFALFALVAAASAQTIRTTADGNLEINVPEGKKFITSRMQTVDVSGMHDNMNYLETGSPKLATLSEVKDMTNTAALDAAARVLNITRDMTLSMANYRATFRDTIKDGIATLRKELQSEQQASEAQINSQVDTFIKTLLANLTEFQQSIGEDLETMTTKAKNGFECGVKGYAFDYATGKCVNAKLHTLGNTPSSNCENGALTYSTSKGVRVCKSGKQDRMLGSRDVFPTVSHSGWSNSDGRDSGYISNRVLKFTKKESSTYIKVTWYDNMRVHGHHWCEGYWHIYVCDQNGNGCSQCNDPGIMMMDKYSHQQHNQWMNDHWAHDVSAICRRTGNRQLNAGTYQLRAYLQHRRCDLYTGHAGQYGSFIVEEVVKN